AYLAGFKWGIENGYEVLCEMDADASHAPEQLHLRLDKIDDGAELVLGSRYVKGGKTVNWPADRKFLSRGGNIYASMALGAGLSDITGGYRAFQRDLLELMDLDAVESAGYVFQVDVAWRAVNERADVSGVPVPFAEPEIDGSKMSCRTVGEAMAQVTCWGFRHRVYQVRQLMREGARIGAGAVARALQS